MNRDEHEAAHQRKYRCANPSCVSFTSGFTTKAALNRHNEKYHPTFMKNISLSEGIVLALRQAPNRKQPTPQLPSFGQQSMPNQIMDGTQNDPHGLGLLEADMSTSRTTHHEMAGIGGANANNITPRSSPSPELSSPPHSLSEPGSPAAQQLTTKHRSAQISSVSMNTFGVEGKSIILYFRTYIFKRAKFNNSQ
jgi:hypothetical protein